MYNHTNHCDITEIILKKKYIRIVAVKAAVCYNLVTNLSSYGEISPTLHILPYKHSFFQKLKMITNNLYALLCPSLKQSTTHHTRKLLN